VSLVGEQSLRELRHISEYEVNTQIFELPNSGGGIDEDHLARVIGHSDPMPRNRSHHPFMADIPIHEAINPRR
jgi:hypothetical protein